MRRRATRGKGAIYFRWMGRKFSFEEVIFTVNDPKEDLKKEYSKKRNSNYKGPEVEESLVGHHEVEKAKR